MSERCQECGKHPAKWRVVARAWTLDMCGVCAGPYRRMEAIEIRGDCQQMGHPRTLTTLLPLSQPGATEAPEHAAGCKPFTFGIGCTCGLAARINGGDA